MKLYTEEQVKKLLWIYTYDFTENRVKSVKKIKPIKLPSDKMIEKEWNDVRLEQDYIDGAIDGAKWMKKQIEIKSL